MKNTLLVASEIEHDKCTDNRVKPNLQKEDIENRFNPAENACRYV